MSYRSQYSGSPWQQGGPPFGMAGYGQNYGGYNDYQMMNAGYNRGYGGGMYGGGMGQMRNMGGYGGPSPSRYGSDRMGGNRQMSRGQTQRKRLPQRSPVSGPRSKRPNLGSDRRSPLRRRRDSRGGSRSKRDDDEDPIEEGAEFEHFDVFKISDDEEEPPKEAVKENGDAEEADGEDKDKDDKEKGKDDKEKSKDEKEKGKDKEKPKKPKKHYCYICKVACISAEGLKRHEELKEHSAKVEELLNARKEKGDKDKDDKKSRRPGGSWCTVCEMVFSGNFLTHRRTKEHRKRRDKKYPKCRPCRLAFTNADEYRNHYKTEEHRQTSAEFHYLKGIISGSDEDEEAVTPMKEQPQEDDVKMADADEKSEEGKEAKESEEDDKEGAEKKEGESDEKKEKEDKKEKEKKKPKEVRAQGQSFVVMVQGYYCKVCRKFFKDVTKAKSKHCRSEMHISKVKVAMEEAFKQEEERQKQMEEQERIDKEASDAAELAYEIRCLQREARDVIRKEFAAKRAEEKKKNQQKDVEMKDVEAKRDSDESKTEDDEKMEEVDGEGEGEDGDDVKMENGVDEKSTKEEKEDADEKDKKEDDADDDGDDDTDKAKEATGPSPKRGRGRARGRKRR